MVSGRIKLESSEWRNVDEMRWDRVHGWDSEKECGFIFINKNRTVAN